MCCHEDKDETRRYRELGGPFMLYKTAMIKVASLPINKGPGRTGRAFRELQLCTCYMGEPIQPGVVDVGPVEKYFTGSPRGIHCHTNKQAAVDSGWLLQNDNDKWCPILLTCWGLGKDVIRAGHSTEYWKPGEPAKEIVLQRVYYPAHEFRLALREAHLKMAELLNRLAWQKSHLQPRDYSTEREDARQALMPQNQGQLSP